MEKGLVELCLWEAKGNRTRAAQMLGITLTTPLGNLKKYGMSPLTQDGLTDVN